ncbi:MAG TPA: ABC transporter permease [Thermodesulfovibrionales bacterium]|nr:ABC transporter permease [Thermodesulfovibrionales bacterium]
MKNKTGEFSPVDARRATGMIRLRGLVRKEFLQILRDPSSIAIAFLMPVLLLFLFGYGVSLDAEHVPVGIVVEKPDQDTSRFIGSFMQSRYFEPLLMSSIAEAVQALESGTVDAVIHLRQDFSKTLMASRDAPVQVIVNGVDANTARIISGYIEGAWIRWLGHEAKATGTDLRIPVQIEQRVWFNSELRSRNYLIPGLIAIIMTLIGALLTAMVMSREWERGTMEALMVTPVAQREILLGKLIPYFTLGIGGMALSVLLAVFLFDVPLRGSVFVLFAASSLFLLTALGMGLLISILAKNQFVAGQAAIIVTFLPAFILSGFIFDINSMPAPIQVITHLIAARYFVSILQTIFLAGTIWSVIAWNALALVIMSTVFLGISRRKFRKRLE